MARSCLRVHERFGYEIGTTISEIIRDKYFAKKSKLCNEQEKVLALEIFIRRAKSVLDNHILSETSV